MKIRSLLLIGALVAVGCRDTAGDDDDDDNTPGADASVEGDDTIYDVQNADMPDGTPVTLRGVVVVAIDNYGGRTGSVWVAEPDDHPTHGRAYSGVLVFALAGAADGLQVGDLVDIEGGAKDEFALNCDTVDCADDTLTLTEIGNAEGATLSITKVGDGTVPAPVTVDPWSLVADLGEAEKWESVLVRFENVAVTTGPHGVSTSDATLEEMTVTGPMDVVSDLVAFGDGIQRDECYVAIQGIVNFFYGWRLLPRDAADYEADGTACLYEADETACGNDLDDDYDGFPDCADFSCQETVASCIKAATVVELQDGTIAGGSRVTLDDVVVTAVRPDGRGLWVQDAGSTADYNGIYVYRGTAPPALPAGTDAVGAVIDVAGRLTEYNGETQVEVDTGTQDLVFVNGDGVPAVRTDVSIATLGHATDGEPYEGMLVSVTAATVVTPDTTFGGFTVGAAGMELTVDDFLYDFALPSAGDCYGTITGVHGYAFDTRQLYPRSADDVSSGCD